MFECRRQRRLLRDQFSGTLDDSGREALQRHAAGCPSCREEEEEMRKLIDTASTHPVPDPGSAYWDGYWERLQARLSADGPSPARPASSRISRWALPAAAAAAAGLALIIGLGRLRPPRPAGPIAAVTPAADLDARTSRYLDRSRLVLLALAKEPTPGGDDYALDLPGRRDAAKALAGEARNLRTGLAKAGKRRLERLVRDLQTVHLQIAHLPVRDGRDGLDVIRSAIADRDLIFQLNLARMRGAAGPAGILSVGWPVSPLPR